jgi:hypothetical protein
LRGDGQQRLQEVLGVLFQHREVSVAPTVLQRGRVAGAGVGLDPVVDRLPGHAEHAGDVASGAAVVEFQDGQGPPEEADVLGGRELPPEAVTLPRSQVELAHALLPLC